ncbi:MAG TPA: protein translocase subunit SecF [Bacteroidota bacterium]|nr:protein translocase subunit SecF [Bacteroidota bacterium]
MRLFKKTNIDFLGKRKMWYAVSGTMMLIGLFGLLFRGITLGIDFRGGTQLIVAFDQNVEISAIRMPLEKIGYGKAEIKYYGAPNNVVILVSEQEAGTQAGDKIKSALSSAMAGHNVQILKEDKIGPKIGQELRRDALLAVLWALIAILSYIAIRFKFKYGLGAVIAIVHDVFTTFGFIALLNDVVGINLEMTQEVIAAFLTLIGASVSDTVIIFDRIRENQKIYRSMPLMDVMNKSLNETLSRTIITSGTIFMVLMILLFFGGEVNRGFAFTMAFGIVTGTYSSIYVASAFVLDWTNYRNKKRAAAALKK